MAHAAARRGFWAGWVYGLGAIAGDLTMLVLTGIGVVGIVERLPWLKVAFALVGAALMAYFALVAWKAARSAGARLGSDEDDRPRSAAKEFAKAYAIVTTSPFNWGWWLTAGSSMLTLLGWATAFGFMVGLLLWTLAWTGLATAGASRVKRLAEIASYGAAIVLGLSAIVMLWYAIRVLSA